MLKKEEKTANKKRIVVHSGDFHADDVFSVAAMQMLFGKENVVVERTRDEKAMSRADMVIDVGGIYDPERDRFDHHQEGGAGKRVSGVPFAGFGLVWRKYGKEIAGSEAAAKEMDEKLVQPIDITDTGEKFPNPLMGEIYQYGIEDAIESFVPTWKENDISQDERFFEAVNFARRILENEIRSVKAVLQARSEVEKAYEKSEDKRLIELESYLPWKEVLVERPEPLFVVYPDEKSGKWHVSAVPSKLKSFDTRKPFPSEWAGKRDEELASVSGVKDAMFCHLKRFFAVAGSREGALSLARLALSSEF